MTRPIAIAALAAMVLSTAAGAHVGFQHFDIPNPAGGRKLEVGIWYPSTIPGTEQPIELDTQIVTTDAPVEGSNMHLIVISHGGGGSYAGHHDTAEALAEARFVAAAVTHDGDSWRDGSRPTHLEDRPQQLEALTQYVLNDWPGHTHLDPDAIGAFGFSAGGFGVLAFAGGEPDLSRFAAHCRDYPDFADCRITAQAAAEGKFDSKTPRQWLHDGRVKAVVVASPAIGFTFGKEGLAHVTAKVQLWRGEDDPVLPNPYYAEAVRQDLPSIPEMHVVPHVGHYDFLAPCSAAMAERLPAICAHEPGFDPVAFHAAFNRDVVRFFEQTLSARSTP